MKGGIFSDSNHYGIALGKDEFGHYVIWQFKIGDNTAYDFYWGHYHMGNKEEAVKDYNNRKQ